MYSNVVKIEQKWQTRHSKTGLNLWQPLTIMRLIETDCVVG